MIELIKNIEKEKHYENIKNTITNKNIEKILPTFSIIILIRESH